MTKKQPVYSQEFKKQIVNLYKSGKPTSEITKEYGITKTSVYSWTKYYANTGSFKSKDNRSDEENELIKLRKENKQLLMENEF